MKLKLTDIERIGKYKCETKDCPNKASSLHKTKYLCKRCRIKVHPTAIDRKLHYINYILDRR